MTTPDGVSKMGSFVLTTKFETKRDPKLDEADL